MPARLSGRWWASLVVATLVAVACGDANGADIAVGAEGTTSSAGEVVPTPSDTGPGCDPPAETSSATTAAATSSSTVVASSATTAAAPTSTATSSTSATTPPSTGATTSTAPSTSSTTEATSSATTATTATTSGTTTTIDQELAVHQQGLTDLGYWLGPVDGRPGPRTSHAVTAFQKAEGLSRTGRLDDATVARLATASAPPVRSASGVVLEVDLARQILLVASNGSLTRVYDIATGAAATPTPAGQFEIYHEIDGYRHAPLGTLYRPKYFNGGIALHGYTSVPTQPASHGCVRLSYAAMDDLWASGMAPVGAAVWVY